MCIFSIISLDIWLASYSSVSVLLVSYVIWSGASDSCYLLLPHPEIALAYHKRSISYLPSFKHIKHKHYHHYLYLSLFRYKIDCSKEDDITDVLKAASDGSSDGSSKSQGSINTNNNNEELAMRELDTGRGTSK